MHHYFVEEIRKENFSKKLFLIVLLTNNPKQLNQMPLLTMVIVRHPNNK